MVTVEWCNDDQSVDVLIMLIDSVAMRKLIGVAWRKWCVCDFGNSGGWVVL